MKFNQGWTVAVQYRWFSTLLLLKVISYESLAVKTPEPAKRLTKARRKHLANVLIKMIPRYHLRHKFYGNKKSDTILFSRKHKKHFKIVNHPRNASKIDLSVSPKSVLAFKTRVSGIKIYLTPFWFWEKS